MTDRSFTRRDLPADIVVLHGTFASQPLTYAHLLDVAPELDLGYVEVIQSGHLPRLEAYFDATVAQELASHGATLILVLPAAYQGVDCPISQTEHLQSLGSFRGRVPHLSETP